MAESTASTAAHRPRTTRRSGLRAATWMIGGGLMLALIGWLPLQWVIWFGPRDANPIGLGLLMITAVPCGLCVAAFGVLRLIIVWLAAPRA